MKTELKITNGVSFIRIGVDQAMEYFIKYTKGQWWISGISSYPKIWSNFASPPLGYCRQDGVERIEAVGLSDKALRQP